MEIKDLTAYAKKKYHCLCYSVGKSTFLLVDPRERKCVSLLLRETDRETGEVLEYGDIRCPVSFLTGQHVSYAGLPHRMKQDGWTGIRFDADTDAGYVFSLFDQAMKSLKTRGYTIVLDEHPVQKEYQASAIPFANGVSYEKVPARILAMMQSYQYGDGSFSWKCRSFLRQGKMMADYEDDVPWDGEIKIYNPTYHDLTPAQLRGYFTWRTQVRKGEYRKTNAVFAYLYVYELLNQIGTSSPEDSIVCLQAFQENVVNVYGEARMKQLVSQWLLGFAAVKRMPLSTVQSCLDPARIQQGQAFTILQNPDDYNEEQIAAVLLYDAHYRGFDAAVYQGRRQEAHALLARMWKIALKMYRGKDGKNLMETVFGQKQRVSWFPMTGAIYDRRNDSKEDVVYQLDAYESLICQNGNWVREKYMPASFKRKLLASFVRACDREIRSYLHLSASLKERKECDWAVPYIKAVIAQDQQEKIKVQRAAVAINFDSLDEIRKDALITQESLMTDEERMDDTASVIHKAEEKKEIELEQSDTETELENPLLNAQQVKILSLLVAEKPVENLIASMHGMPEVIADEINEALFEQIGDAAVSCIDGKLSLQEDYRDDIVSILKGECDR